MEKSLGKYSQHSSRRMERPAETGFEPDFRVSYSRSAGWQIEVISRRAHEWAKVNANPVLFSNDGGRIRTDLAGVNLFVHNARSEGLKTEYIGPQRILIF